MTGAYLAHQVRQQVIPPVTASHKYVFRDVIHSSVAPTNGQILV